MAGSKIPLHKRTAMAKTITASNKEAMHLKSGGMLKKGSKKCDGGMAKR